MAIIGWVVCLVIVFKITVMGVLVVANCTGTYNIGGAVNSTKTRSKAWAFFIVALSLWYPIYLTFPFTVAPK